jgi:hypothetical protein
VVVQWSFFVTWKQWKGPTEDRGTMATTIMCLLLFLLFLWLPCNAVRSPSNSYVKTNNSANFTERISLHANVNAYLNHRYVSDIQHTLPLNYRRTSNFQNLSRNYGQTTEENPLLNYKKALEDGHLLFQTKTSTVPHRSLRQTASQEDSTFRLRYIPNIYGNLPQTRNQVKTQNGNRQNIDKKDNFGIPESVQNDSPFSYRQSESEYKFTSDKDNPTMKQLPNDHPDLNYRQTSKDSVSYNTRKNAMSVEERSEQAEARRLSGSDHIKMNSDEQELMLLDILHQKTNSSSRGFEATLADMLGKSESVFITFQ